MALKPISKIAAGVQASTTLAIDSLFKQMKAEGKDVVGFGAGEPDFPTPEHIKQAGIEAIENNQTKYTPAAGLMDLRKAVWTTSRRRSLWLRVQSTRFISR